MLQPESAGLQGLSAAVFHVIYLYHAAEHSPFPITLRGPRCLGLQNKALHFRLETLCIWAYSAVSSRGEKK